MTKNEFLKVFCKSEESYELIDTVLKPMLYSVADVNSDVPDKFKDYTMGELFMGKKFAAYMIEDLITEIEYWREKEEKKEDPRNKMN